MATARGSRTQGSTSAFVQRAMRAPLLSRENELDLARRWSRERDSAALDELVNSYSRLVIKMAAKFRGYGLPIDDLIQQGHMGLLEALMRFDPERSVRLSTYASWWIRASIQDYILRNWSIVRIGTTTKQKALFFNLRRLRAKIAATKLGLMGPENRDLIASELNVTESDVAAMELRLAAGDQSLNAPVGREADVEAQDLLEDDAPSPENVVIEWIDGKRRSTWLREAVELLPEREQIIINKRHLCEEPMTLEQLGNRFGVSKERARQLEKGALEQLRDSLRRKVDA